MFNDFPDSTRRGRKVKVSVPRPSSSPPSASTRMREGGLDGREDCGRPRVRDWRTKEELGGSEYFARLGTPVIPVPVLDAAAAKERYARSRTRLPTNSWPRPSRSATAGLAVALAKSRWPGGSVWTSRSPCRIRCGRTTSSSRRRSPGSWSRVAPGHKRAFEQALGRTRCCSAGRGQPGSGSPPGPSSGCGGRGP